MRIISSTQKKKILAQLKEQYGITNLPYLLLQFGKEKIRLYSGSFSKEELIKIDKNLRIEHTGLYSLNIQNENSIRLTLDGTQILKPQISKNILEINEDQAEQWLKGSDLDIQTDKSFKVLKNNEEFLGTGKSTGEKITNFVPKERRVK